jgi:hypothetical protein
MKLCLFKESMPSAGQMPAMFPLCHTVNYHGKQHVAASVESIVLKEMLESLRFNFFESYLYAALCNTKCA